jgi:NADPH:quinone reductase-like Zn-dependent oxidoreductase
VSILGSAELVALPPACLSAPLSMVNALSLPLISDFSSTRPSPSYSLLAALPEAFLTAHGILMASLQIGPTDTLLVQGGSSAVGLAIACLAKNMYGLKEVVGTTRSKDKVTRMEASGYSTVIVLPGHQAELPVPSELSEMIKRKSGHLLGFAAIVDLVGATNVPISLLCARRIGGSKVCMAGMLNGAYYFQQPFSPMSIVSVRRFIDFHLLDNKANL